MINQVTLIGRAVDKPTLRKFEEGFSVTTLTLAVTRPFKNIDGNYDCDFIRITLWNATAEATCEYVEKGDVLGVKGRLIVRENDVTIEVNDVEHKKKIHALEVVGDRVVFISLGRKKTDEIYSPPIEDF